MADQELLETISRKLSVLIALSLSPDLEVKNLSEKISVLTRLGLSNGDIAEILGATRSTVEVLKSRMKKKK